MDSQGRIYDPGYIAIKDGRIVGIGAIDSKGCCGLWEARNTIDATGTLIMPGYVNTHTHIAMSPFRGAMEDAEDRLRRFIFPLEKTVVDPQLVYDGALFSIAEMVRSGTTCFADMYYFEEEVARAADYSGMRAIVGETIVDFPAPDCDIPYGGIERAKSLSKEWRNHTRIKACIAPHAPYTVDASNLRLIAHTSEAFGIPIMMHIAEMDFEYARFSQSHGSVLRYLDETGILSSSLIGVHMLYLDDQDIEIAAQRKIAVAHCPGSNAKSGRPICPAWQLSKAGVAIGLGTDGPLSGNTMDMQNIVSLYPKLQKVREHKREIVSAQEALYAATIGGAEVLGLSDQIGSIECGKCADLQIVDLNDFNALPVHNWYATAVYSLQAHNVRDTIVAGSFLMRQRKIMFANEEKLKENLLYHAKKSSSTIASLLEKAI
jgi:cytosine/adenosine deaminase-related metal-dependent hydrolase